jgi:ArsR family transcriptional regulator, arsenate/arsenite/antimonite-responsive transcriptional repressor
MDLLATIDGCCAVGDVPLTKRDADKLARAFKVLGDPARLRLLSLIAAQDEVCQCDLQVPLGLSQPTVSHHLKVLVDAGFLQREKRGTWAYYRVVRDALATLKHALTP